MSILPGQPVSTSRGAGRLELAQQYQNALLRELVDNTSLAMQVRNKTATEVAAQIQQANMAMTQNMQVRSMQIKHLLNNLLPEQCRKHVYKVDHEHSVIDDCEIVKWTFYNDLSVRLKVAANIMLDSGDAEPIIEDFEFWQADALMKCEAGEDVWPRPKPNTTQQGASSLNSGQTNSLSSLMQQQSLAGSQHLNHSEIGNALAGALGLGGLFK